MVLTNKVLPFEIDKVYTTKFQTKDKFLVKEIRYDKKDSNKVTQFSGYYVGKEDIGLCPLNGDRLIPESIALSIPLIIAQNKNVSISEVKTDLNLFELDLLTAIIVDTFEMQDKIGTAVNGMYRILNAFNLKIKDGK